MSDDTVVMFEEAGVGAEEVVSSNDYDLCFVTGVDPAEVGDGEHFMLSGTDTGN